MQECIQCSVKGENLVYRVEREAGWAVPSTYSNRYHGIDWQHEEGKQPRKEHLNDRSS